LLSWLNPPSIILQRKKKMDEWLTTVFGFLYTPLGLLLSGLLFLIIFKEVRKMEKFWRNLIVGFLLAMGVVLNLFIASRMVSP